jgi:polyisoprenoid-binding protein YceI
MSSTTTATQRTTWTIDPAHTLVEFSAKHMMITTVKGRFSDVKGTITIDEAQPDRSTAEATIDAKSIDTRSEDRDKHLRSPEFLDAAQFGTVTFKSRRIQGASNQQGKSFKVTGDLTIHGVAREITLDTTYEGRGKDPWGGERVSFSADTKIDRRDYGLIWNAALETGGVLVSNDIKIHIEVQAVRAA